MRYRISKPILCLMILGVLLLTLYICGKQVMTAADTHVEKINDRYSEIDKALGRE